jgi:nitroreductase
MVVIRFFIRFIKYSTKGLFNLIRLINIDMSPKFEPQRLRSSSIKMCHSLEKGLSLKNPKAGFGIKKAENVLSNIELYKKNKYDMNNYGIKIIYGVLIKYIEFQKKHKIDITKIEHKFNSVFDSISISTTSSVGGFISISHCKLEQEEKAVFTKITNTRHSIRSFSNEEVPLEDIKKSVEIALRAPSACNRQPSRVYVIDNKHKKELLEFLEGSGGFENEANKYLIVTSDISAFELREKNQWLVSTGIFVGYLSLALHANDIAACIVERNLDYNDKNKKFSKKFGIPKEEQIVCAILIGKYTSNYNVPVSKRYDTEYIIKEIS